MEIIIKEAQWKDIYLIHQVIQEAFYEMRAYYPQGQVPALRETPQDISEDLRSKRVFTAWVDEQLVGTIRYSLTMTGVAYISRFAISPRFQKGGIGKKLLDAVLAEVEEKQGDCVTLHANYNIASVIGFYLHNGFQIGEISIDKGYPRVYLVKQIRKGCGNYETLERQVYL